MSKTTPRAGLINAMTSAINLDNEILQENRERKKNFVWPWSRVFATLAVFEALLGLVIAGIAGFSDAPIGLGEAVLAGILVIGSGITGWVVLGPGGSPKDKAGPRDIPPVTTSSGEEEEEEEGGG